MIAIAYGERGHHLPLWTKYFIAGYRFMHAICCGHRKPKNTSIDKSSKDAYTSSAPAQNRQEEIKEEAGATTISNIPMVDSDAKEENQPAPVVSDKEAEKEEQALKNEKKWRYFAEALDTVFNIIFVVLNIVIFVVYMVPLFIAYFVNLNKATYYKDS